MSVDFPEPETPVIQVKTPTGSSSVTSFKLFPVAPINLKTFDLSIDLIILFA